MYVNDDPITLTLQSNNRSIICVSFTVCLGLLMLLARHHDRMVEINKLSNRPKSGRKSPQIDITSGEVTHIYSRSGKAKQVKDTFRGILSETKQKLEIIFCTDGLQWVQELHGLVFFAYILK